MFPVESRLSFQCIDECDPAKVAGVDEIIMTTPPGKDGKVNPGTLVAADIAGVDTIS